MLARAVTFNVLGQVGSLAVGFFASILTARWLGPADRGLLALMLSAGRFVVAAGAEGLPAAVAYHASRKQASAGALLGNCIAFAVGFGGAVVVAAVFAHGWIGDVLARGHGGLLWVAAAVLVPITILDWTTNNQLTGRLRFGLFNGLTIVAKVATLLSTVVLIGWLGLGVGGGLAAAAVSSAVMIGGALVYLLRLERPRIDLPLFGELFRYGGRVQLGAFFQLMNYRLDVLLLQIFLPLSAVGVYVMAQVLAELVIVLASGFQTGLLPLVARSGEDESLQTTTSALRHHALLALGRRSAANAVLGMLVILFALGPGYRDALVPFLILLPGVWFLGTGTVVNGDLRGRNRPGLASILTGLAVLVTVALDLLLIPHYGISGAAVASLCAYAVFGVVSIVALARVTGTTVGSLLVPTRAELAVYRAVARRLRPA